jgi:hypothetical protein
MHPIEIDATLKLAKRKLREGKVPEAEAMYRNVLAEQPDKLRVTQTYRGTKR